MPAGEVSALLQLEVNAVAVYFLIQIFSESRKKKKSRYPVRAHVGGWCTRLVSCLQTGLWSRQPKPPWWQKSCTNSIVSPLGVASVPAGELPGTEGERGLALCHTSYCIFRNGRSLCLAFDERASCEPLYP